NPTNGQTNRSVSQIRTAPIRSYRRPIRIMLRIGMNPVPYTMAFGGVETGKAKPRLAPRQAPRAGGTGDTPTEFAMAMTTGITMLAVAVLDASSLSRTATTTAMAVRLQT